MSQQQKNVDAQRYTLTTTVDIKIDLLPKKSKLPFS